jgi:hypothetical protein
MTTKSQVITDAWAEFTYRKGAHSEADFKEVVERALNRYARPVILETFEKDVRKILDNELAYCQEHGFEKGHYWLRRSLESLFDEE